MDKQEQSVMDEFVNRHNGVNEFGAAYFEINGTEFTSEQFNHRALELGWVNGYKWGVEYPTDGKKPDLPSGTEIRLIGYAGQFLTVSFPGEVQHDYFNWGNSKYFIITDKRYKPKQPEPHSKPVADNSWHEKGEQPPVGSVVEFKYKSDIDWSRRTAKIIAIHEDIVWMHLSENVRANLYALSSFDFRPTKTEREKFVEAAIEFICESGVITKGGTLAHEIAGNLHDSGCRFVSQESSR